MNVLPACRPLPFPERWNALLDPRRDHLDDVAPAERDPFPGKLDGASFRFDFGGQAFEFVGAGDERRKVEAECVKGLPSPAPPHVALPVRAVSADDEPGVDQDRQMPPQCRRRHSVRAEGELLV